VVTDAELLPAAEEGTVTEAVVTAGSTADGADAAAGTEAAAAPVGRPRRRRAASRPAGPPA
jgi:ribonuclease E